ncbi:hypothetical protein OAG85_01320 [Verrucomicrobiales bacterium]|nr:hypothetical protein [Verrucomicrobiales bacterium]
MASPSSVHLVILHCVGFLEKIAGRKPVVLYNLANGILFCFLAGAMITVSATAVIPAIQSLGIPTSALFQGPSLTAVF